MRRIAAGLVLGLVVAVLVLTACGDGSTTVALPGGTVVLGDDGSVAVGESVIGGDYPEWAPEIWLPPDVDGVTSTDGERRSVYFTTRLTIDELVDGYRPALGEPSNVGYRPDPELSGRELPPYDDAVRWVLPGGWELSTAPTLDEDGTPDLTVVLSERPPS